MNIQLLPVRCGSFRKDYRTQLWYDSLLKLLPLREEESRPSLWSRYGFVPLLLSAVISRLEPI